jgi:hypothetical protein
MNKSLLCKVVSSTFLVMGVFAGNGQSGWRPVNLKLPTRWSGQVSPDHVLPEYPRPQMARKQWTSLNGLWDYCITPKEAARPAAFSGRILVPFPIESALSGVQQMLGTEQLLWYKRSFNVAAGKGERTLLHFGAVDNEATVFVNGKEVGGHKGGYTEFTIDVTTAVRSGSNELMVKVYDPTDKGVWPHGKQVSDPQNIYYTPSSGIWQTVWLETVPRAYITGLSLTPDIDQQLLHLKITGPEGYAVVVTTKGAELKGAINTDLKLKVNNMRLWSPADPYLYDLTIQLVKGGKIVDEVSSYFGMRKISIGKDAKGMDRIFLNNKAYFNLGTLDQGFWPDGLYTAPTDEALAFDIRAIKAMGFNTIRKHIKVEPARWYYHADQLGMLVWQDMVNPNQGLPEGAKPAFEAQSKETLAQLHNYPCITTWVLFNEKWGQYDQERLTKWIKQTDPSRIVNGHTGELLYVNDRLRSPSPDAYVAADMTDVHAYPDPMISIRQPGKARVVGEFGGIGVFIPDHQWNSAAAWGYVQEKPASLQAKYTIMNQHLVLLEREGLSASIYTQPFDVETEQNGLMTYDRDVVKIPFDTLRRIHAALNPEMGPIPAVTAQNADMTEPGLVYSRMLQLYIDGRRDAGFLMKLAMAATQAGDKAGRTDIGNDYLSTVKAPVSEADARLVTQFAGSSKDAGFALMMADPGVFKKVMGERPYTLKIMNMIFTGDMQALIDGQPNPDWTTIEARVKPYGSPGEEILLRAETVYFINNQHWDLYVPVAKMYIARYGANIPESERKMFQDAISEHDNTVPAPTK